MPRVKALDVGWRGGSHILQSPNELSLPQALEAARLHQSNAYERGDRTHFFIGEKGQTEVDSKAESLCPTCKEQLRW